MFALLKNMKKILSQITALLLLFTLSGCVEVDKFDNSLTGNFDALWNIIDQRYCFFDYSSSEFGLDWDAVYHKYRPKAELVTTNSALFDLMGEMLRELRIKPSGFSKYCIGSALTNPKLKRNRFKPRFKKIDKLLNKY